MLGSGIKRMALLLQPIVERRMVLLTPVVGLAIGGMAVVFAEATDKGSSEVLFAGQSALPSLIHNAGSWTVGALVLLIALQGSRLRRLVELLPRRSDVSRHVHRCGRWHRPVPPSRVCR